MKKIVVIGCPGAGKSTLCRKLQQQLALPLYHLDQLFWLPNWQQAAPDVFLKDLQRIIQMDAWIIDGNFVSSLPQRLAAADHVVWLDMPRYRCLLRVMKRVMTNYGRTRQDMTAGCPEKIDVSFLKFIWQFKKIHYPQIEAALTNFPSNQVTRINSKQALEAFLTSLG